ncbi:proline--tRNA ligase [Facklamia miroungae]|uniref:Proline--tRNA ligase n=1 Tax=Facklamia miroungae TaxID=120956 RepID=A0A1G7S0H7_9LACT|nr:proline--tRNA ligase [Facklamia miroungae]NKZ29210.1 proline--tRNA ligase [Facklamia miroungae]SDG16533.1 prolyl-tRNA synthetase [Facklamia miroungae]
MVTRKEDFSKWYLQTIQQADLMDYSPVRGCMIFKPNGYEIWEHIQDYFNKRLKEEGVRNAYFPMLIPESFFTREKDHIEGFSPELPWVTEAAGEVLEERLALRPTSETMIGDAFSKWINSYRDLPYEINQWANVFRWEKRTLPFLRTSEFLWQEGHTAHANEEDARQRTMRMLGIYAELLEDLLAVPVFMGEKTPSERFAGAVQTFSVEAMMQDGKAVQAGTSHYMGTKFAEAFNIRYLNQDNEHVYAHTTSWGVSTRLIGSVIMTHSDDQGLVLPPAIAPQQVVFIPVGPKKKLAEVMSKVDELNEQLKAVGLRTYIDDSDNSAGYKFNEWELRGAALRIEVGPRDIENNQVIMKARDEDEKYAIAMDSLSEKVQQALEDMQKRLLQKARQRNQANMYTNIDTLDELVSHIESKKAANEVPGWVLIGWDGSEESEAKIKELTGFTTRNIPFNQYFEGEDALVKKETCIVTGKPAQETVWIARAY